MIDPFPFILIVGFVVAWMMVSIPVYISARIVTAGRIGYFRSMAATLLGPIAYATVFAITSMVLNVAFDMQAFIIAFIIAILAWLGTFKVIFKTSWLATIGIAILALIIFIISMFVLGFIMLAIVPDASMQTPLPAPMIEV